MRGCLLVLGVVCSFVLPAQAYAEVLELEGTVTAVDATARSITIERKTPNGVKTLDLEVNKKAGDLAGVDVGDQIAFSYDPDLEIVTLIAGNGAGNKASIERKRCRVRLSISDTGDCVIGAERASAAESAQTSLKKEDGRWVFRPAFTKPSDLDAFEGAFGPVLNVRVSGNRASLLFEPRQVVGPDKNISQLTCPQRFRVPIEVAVDLSAIDANFLFQLQPLPALSGQRQLVVSIKSADAFAETARVEVAGMVRDAQGKPSFGTPFVPEQTVLLNASWEKRFRLPVPNMRSRDTYVMRLGSMGESVVEVTCLTIVGIPVPTIGIGVGDKDGIIFAGSVVPDSLAEQAGVEVGDVITAIRGKPISSVKEAMELLAELPFNVSSAITIQRGDIKKTLHVTPTFAK